MADLNRAAVSPGTVYNVPQRGGLTKKWAEKAEEGKKGFDQPKAVTRAMAHGFFVHQICGNFYYFVSVMGGYSRKILSWGLYGSMYRLLTGYGRRRY
jgi:hypothetical protein